VINAHSLYLETLSDLGAVGGLLLALFLGSALVAAFRSRTRPAGLGRSQTAAAGAAFVVWMVAAGLDWAWQVPAFTGMAIVLAASMYPQARRVRRSPPAAPETAEAPAATEGSP
jgi:O-antigen ligase